MSGIEIAGLVLGALPLLIAGLEAYKKGLKPVETFLWKWKSQLERLIRCLKQHRLLFRQNMRRLVAAAAPSEEPDLAKDDDIFTFMRRPDICLAVQTYLDDGESLEFFVDILDDCRTHLEAVVGHLKHIQHPVQTSSTLKAIINANPVLNGTYAFKERFNFTMKHKEMKGLVDHIDDCNDKLDRFLDNVDRISKLTSNHQPDKPSGLARALAASFQKVWNHANALHSAVSTCWPLGCHSTHQAMLFLETRAALASKSTMAQPPTFRLVLSTDTNVQAPHSWSESEIAVVDMNEPSSPSKQEVLNLCHHLAQENLSNKAWMMDLTQDQKLFCCQHSTCDSWAVHDREAKPLSLGEYLRANHGLMPKDITILALTLASSMLQLHQTQWVNQAWTKDIIQVFQKRQASRYIIDWERPFIAASFPTTYPDHTHSPHPNYNYNYNHTHTITPSTPTTPSETRVKEDLLELGIILLEIWEQQTFESWLTSIDCPPSMASQYYVKMGLAIRWLETAQDRWPLAYADAVSACVRFSFEGVAHSWGHPEFRRAVCEKVVAPLQQNCRAWVRMT